MAEREGLPYPGCEECRIPKRHGWVDAVFFVALVVSAVGFAAYWWRVG